MSTRGWIGRSEATAEARSIYTTAELFRVPTLNEYSGEEGFAYIAPKTVSSMVPSTIKVGSEAPFTKTINGTTVYTEQEAFFVPLPVGEVASLLYISLVAPTSTSGTGLNFAPPRNENV